jgi:hypothetical protein
VFDAMHAFAVSSERQLSPTEPNSKVGISSLIDERRNLQPFVCHDLEDFRELSWCHAGLQPDIPQNKPRLAVLGAAGFASGALQRASFPIFL